MSEAPRPLTGGAVMGAAGRASVAVTGAATTILVARLLGADGAGAFAIALTIVYVLVVLCTLGVEHGIAYHVSAGRWRPADAFRTSQLFAIAVGAAGALAGVTARLALPSAFGGLSVAECALAAAALPFALAWYYASFVALADDHYEGYVLPPAVQSIALMVLAVALAIPLGIAGAVVALLASHVLTAAATYARGPRGGARAAGKLGQALAFGVKSYAAVALQVLNYRVDFFILSAVATAAALGHYAVAVAVTTVLWLLPHALADVLFPRVAALSAADEAAHRDFVEAKSLRHTALAVAISGLAVAFALVFLVTPIYGPDFDKATELGLIRLPGVALIGLSGTLAASIAGRGHPEYGLYTTLIVTPVTLALYVVLIPRYEAPGAALASSLSFTATFVAMAIFYRRATGHGVLGRLLPTHSEFDDYRMLWPKIREWVAAILARRRA
jgi:O-antigen/teichoic acid export membrane protein